MPNPKVSPPQPPPFWNQVPKSLWRRLKLEDVFRNVLASKGQPEDYGLYIALSSLDSYVEAAKRQQRRIKAAMVAPWRPGGRSHSSIFGDTHFYLISWSRVGKLIKHISTRTKFPRVGLVWRRYHSDFKSRIDGRDHLEHFEDRLPGGPKVDKLKKNPNDLFNISRHHMTYGGNRLDVGPNSLKLLLTATSEFRAALLYDSIEALANVDGPRLRRLLDKATREHNLARIEKEVRKTLNATKSKN